MTYVVLILRASRAGPRGARKRPECFGSAWPMPGPRPAARPAGPAAVEIRSSASSTFIGARYAIRITPAPARRQKATIARVVAGRLTPALVLITAEPRKRVRPGRSLCARSDLSPSASPPCERRRRLRGAPEGPLFFAGSPGGVLPAIALPVDDPLRQTVLHIRSRSVRKNDFRARRMRFQRRNGRRRGSMRLLVVPGSPPCNASSASTPPLRINTPQPPGPGSRDMRHRFQISITSLACSSRQRVRLPRQDFAPRNPIIGRGVHLIIGEGAAIAAFLQQWPSARAV